MTIPRKQKVDITTTPYYHCYSRCVRQSFLCGIDTDTQRDYSHRKIWIVERIKQVADAFAIRVCAYAVMSNHYHVVLEVQKDRMESWDDQALLLQWEKIYSKDAAAIKLLFANGLLEVYNQRMQQIREHLIDISWFMKSINEWVARRANQEDGKKGRFWDGRFGSQALLDEQAVLSAMVYVDLNPIRAGICERLEDADYTSIQEHIFNYAQNQTDTTDTPSHTTPIAIEDYIQLVESTGRCLIADQGCIPSDLPPLLSRLDMDMVGWLAMTQRLETAFSYAVGSYDAIARFGAGKRPPKGSALAKSIYRPAKLAA